MRAAIGVEAHRQTGLGKDLPERPEGRGCALFLDQKRRIDRPRRVVERDNEVKGGLALEPGVARAVLVQHHAWQRPPLALPAVRPLARRLRHDARPLQMQLEPGVAPAEAMILDEMLVEGLDREALVALAIKPLHFFRPIARDPLARRLAEPAIDEPGLAFLLISARPAPERPLRHPEQLGRLFLVQLRQFPTAQKIQKHRHAHPLRASVRRIPTPPKGAGPTGQIVRYLNRTYRVLRTRVAAFVAITGKMCYLYLC